MGIEPARGPFLAVLALLSLTTMSVRAAPAHPCASHAADQALKLLRFHGDNDARTEVIDNSVKTIGTIKALSGDGRFDVIEIYGGIHKADYRIRMIYAQIPGECILMGQEVIAAGDPY